MSVDVQDDPEPGAEGYRKPRNAIVELFDNAPPFLHDLMRLIETEAEESSPIIKWPHAPYHYGMGRIQAYDEWLATLDEHERARAIAACIGRDETRHDQIAVAMVDTLRAVGIDLTRINRREHEGDEQLREVARVALEARTGPPDPGPDRGGPSQGRGRTRRREP